MRESFIISLGILPILSFYFSEFQPWSILLTLSFSFIWYGLVTTIINTLLPVMDILLLQFNFLFEWLENMDAMCFSAIYFVELLFLVNRISPGFLRCLLVLALSIYDYRKNLKKAPYLSFYSFLVNQNNHWKMKSRVLDMEQGTLPKRHDRKTILQYSGCRWKVTAGVSLAGESHLEPNGV